MHDDTISIWKVVLYSLAGLMLATLLLGVGASGCKAWGRYQKRADANNAVRVSAIEIRNQAQRIKVTKQRARIRFEQAVGIREAQDEISRTLTPLYVQFEMIDALRQVATSGKNNSVVYIPTGANGLPIVPTVNSTQPAGAATP